MKSQNKLFESYKSIRKFTTKTPQVFKNKKQYKRREKHVVNFNKTVY